MTWIKICGITNLEDAQMAVDAGADALGFVFYEHSPRYLDPNLARAIISALPQSVEKVAVFGPASVPAVRAALKHSGATAIQVCVDAVSATKDDDCPSFFEQLAGRTTKLVPVLSMRSEQAERRAMMWNPDAVYAFLLDSGSGGQPGGTGKQFDWAAKQAATTTIKRLANIIVAGGLTPADVSQAMGILKPWGVDVSSGVEASPGKKDPEKVRAFIAAVRQADRDL